MKKSISITIILAMLISAFLLTANTNAMPKKSIASPVVEIWNTKTFKNTKYLYIKYTKDTYKNYKGEKIKYRYMRKNSKKPTKWFSTNQVINETKVLTKIIPKDHKVSKVQIKVGEKISRWKN